MSTTFSVALQIHMKTHNGEKPYKLTSAILITHKHKLQKHKMTHTGEKAHKYNHSFTCM